MANSWRYDNAHSINAALDIHFDTDAANRTPKQLVRLVRDSLMPRTDGDIARIVIGAIRGKRIRTAERRDALVFAFSTCQPARGGSFDLLSKEIAADPNKYLPEQE